MKFYFQLCPDAADLQKIILHGIVQLRYTVHRINCTIVRTNSSNTVGLEHCLQWEKII